MKTKLWKAFWDYEKEEKWLNELSAKGLAMTAYTFCRYTFEDCTPGEYIYRIELLEHSVNHPESVRYIRFMEENGVEHIDTYLRWAYFRKKTTDGDFKIYSDFTARIKHYQRIAQIWFIICCLDLSIGFLQFSIVIHSWINGDQYRIANFAIGILLISLGASLMSLWGCYAKRIRHLKREQKIHE